MLSDLDFSTNWNHKLDCDCYTTIRLNSDKYYVGNQFNVRLSNVDHHKAEVIDVKIFKLAQINNYIAHLDTGYNVEDCKTILRKMYKEMADHADFVLVLMKKLK